MDTNKDYMTVDMSATGKLRSKTNKDWEKEWEETCLCNTCKNNCYDRDMIVDACSAYIENAN